MQQPLRARVRNGRLAWTEPTDLPRGEEVELVPLDADDMDDEERAALRAELRAFDRRGTRRTAHRRRRCHRRAAGDALKIRFSPDEHSGG